MHGCISVKRCIAIIFAVSKPLWRSEKCNFGYSVVGYSWKCILCVFVTLVLIEGGTVILRVNLVLNHRSAPDIPVLLLG